MKGESNRETVNAGEGFRSTSIKRSPLRGPWSNHNGECAFRKRGCGSVIAASCAEVTVPAPMEFHRRGRPVARKPLALSAAQTAVDVNEAKNNEH